MPPRMKTQEEITAEQDIILDAALGLIAELGYRGLAMRLIARQCNTSATKIYYYFKNKEEIYFGIMNRGYQALITAMEYAEMAAADPSERFTAAVESICRYGVENKYCYDLLFSSLTPRCSDIEESPVASAQQKSGRIFYGMWQRTVYEAAAFKGKNITDYDCALIFSRIHGLISLHNSGNLKEIEIDYNEALKQLLQQLLL